MVIWLERGADLHTAQLMPLPLTVPDKETLNGCVVVCTGLVVGVGLLSLHFWHCPHSMRSSVYETVQCPSICPSQHGLLAADPLLQVCCCEPGVSSRRMRAVPLCQHAWIAGQWPKGPIYKYLTTILLLSYDNAKGTIDLRPTSNLQTSYKERKAFFSYGLLAESWDRLR